jgi:hypothetical protein
MQQFLRQRVLAALFMLTVAVLSNTAAGHGSVEFSEDLCVVNVNFLQAHFTVFQPETRESEEFCENIPDVARSVFVMEYLHDLLAEMRVDFRIIEDVNEIGQYARWQDIEAIEDLEAATVFYESPRVEPGGFYTSSYEFNSRGTYIGIVTAEHPTEDRNYNAVFYFQVGGPDLGTIPLFIGLLILLQSGYWYSSGGYTKLRARLAARQRIN